MTIGLVEAIAIVSAGFVCALSTGYGFVLQALRKLYLTQWTGRIEVIWIAAMVTTMIFVTLGTVFVMVYMVYGNDPNAPGFWDRMLAFGTGVAVGFGFAFGSCALINRGLRQSAGSNA